MYFNNWIEYLGHYTGLKPEDITLEDIENLQPENTEPEWEYTFSDHIGSRYEADPKCKCSDCFGDFSGGDE